MRNKFIAALFLLAITSTSTFASAYFPEIVIRARPGLTENSVDESIDSSHVNEENSDIDIASPISKTEETQQ